MTPEQVSGERLRELWFSDAAVGMTDDHQTGQRVVHMADGTSYAASFTELSS